MFDANPTAELVDTLTAMQGTTFDGKQITSIGFGSGYAFINATAGGVTYSAQVTLSAPFPTSLDWLSMG